MDVVEISATPTRIAAVTVFRNGALVTRKGRGRGRVLVHGLPLLFSSDSLRVRAHAGVVADVQESVRLVSRPAPAQVSEEEWVKLNAALAAVDEELRWCDALLSLLDGMTPELPPAQSPIGPRFDGAAWSKLSADAAARADALFDRKRTLMQQRRDLDQQRARLSERDVGDERPPQVLRGVQFSLDEPGAGELDFELEYFVTAARWVPTYALQLTSTKQGARAALATGALIAQASGEEWAGVALSVSTADLLRDSALPSLTSWRIGRAQPAVHKGFRPLPSDLPSLFHGYDHGPRQSVPPTSTSTTTEGGPPADKPKPPPARRPERSGRRARQESADEDERADRGGGGGGDFEVASSGEVASFREQQSMLGGMAAFDAKEAMMDAPPAPPPAQAPGGRPMPAPAMSMPMPASKSAAPMMDALSRAPQAAFGAVAELAKKRDESVARVAEELPPRWRAGFLRMAGADEPRRGTLVPMNPLERLEWLLSAYAVEPSAVVELRRAIQGLQAAEQRIHKRPLPKGTQLLSDAHFPTLLTAAQPCDIPGDGIYHRVQVRTDESAAVFEHRAVPRQANDVWRFCKLEPPPTPLPPGPLSIYEDGTFVVTARFEPAAGKKTVDVNLGVDPDVRVLSRTAHVHQAEKGLISSTSRVEHKVKVELRSTRGTPAQVVVYDRLPVPVDNLKDVTVTLVEDKPPIKRTDRDDKNREVVGAFEWRVTLMPGDTMHLEHCYAIDLPAKAELEGGNRRE